MFSSPKKQCKLSHKIMIRLNNFLYIFNLRQGTILIAIHQIALSAFVLIILLVGISHVGEMMSMLHNDMDDDVERHGFYPIMIRNKLQYHEEDGINSNNQRRFATAQHLASATVIFLYTSTVLMTIYMICCIALLHGAIKYRRQYVMPWLGAACVGVVLLVAAAIVGDGYPCVVNIFGGHNLYYFSCTLFVITFIYAICAVGSFAMETGGGGWVWCAGGGAGAGADERGERLLLLDHAAHSSLLSASQINRLSHGTRSQFV